MNSASPATPSVVLLEYESDLLQSYTTRYDILKRPQANVHTSPPPLRDMRSTTERTTSPTLMRVAV